MDEEDYVPPQPPPPIEPWPSEPSPAAIPMPVPLTMGISVDDDSISAVAFAKASSEQDMQRIFTYVRQRYVTDLPGQEMIYLRKEQEAAAYLSADPEPSTLVDFPFIAAEVGITAPTAFEVAQIYANLANIWKSLGAYLETARMQAKYAITASTTVPEAYAVVTATRQALEAQLGTALTP
jgi:hypothetical protein